MAIGQLRHRLTIHAVTSTSKNSFGERVETTTDLGKCWGSVQPLSGKELQEARGVDAHTTHKITIRYRPNLNTAQQIIHKGRTFEIESMLNRDERNRWLTLLCREST